MTDEEYMLLLWKWGNGTAKIAEAVGKPEWEVQTILRRIRDESLEKSSKTGEG